MNPKAGAVAQNSTVTLQIAKAPTTVAVPDVVGKTQKDAASSLQAAGLNVAVTSAPSTSVPPVAKDNVISQNVPATTQVALGTTITITVSTGPGTPVSKAP
jgi:serine/threonine-protein kinase